MFCNGYMLFVGGEIFVLKVATIYPTFFYVFGYVKTSLFTDISHIKRLSTLLVLFIVEYNSYFGNSSSWNNASHLS